MLGDPQDVRLILLSRMEVRQDRFPSPTNWAGDGTDKPGRHSEVGRCKPSCFDFLFWLHRPSA